MTGTPNKSRARPVYLNDYSVPDYLIDKTHLHFDIKGNTVVVNASLQVYRNPQLNNQQAPLVLNGVDLELRQLTLNGKKLSEKDITVDRESLTIHQVPVSFTLECVTELKPENNTALVGLFKSGEVYCTQCEPQGFRHITYYLDRPDVMSEFTTTLVADQKRFPVLLSNGNFGDQGLCDCE